MLKSSIPYLFALPLIVMIGMSYTQEQTAYEGLYRERIRAFQQEQEQLIHFVEQQANPFQDSKAMVKAHIAATRHRLKALDFWLRYLEPVTYKKLNGPLPVEWETEVFEKFEAPYKREGAGLTLAEGYLDEPGSTKEGLLNLLRQSDVAIKVYEADSLLEPIRKPDHFFFANRLFLLNLAAIYTTGFECPDPARVIDELQQMIACVQTMYTAFNVSFPSTPVTEAYLQQYAQMLRFVESQSKDPNRFDHFHFIKDFVNPLYALNQELIRQYRVRSRSYNDYSLSNDAPSIFDKRLYHGQNRKGIFLAVNDTAALREIQAIGKLLFFDPILSGNGKRSCASCHLPTAGFTDTSEATSLAFDGMDRLPRNTPSLLNVGYHHLLMLDGKHTSLQKQARDVITNPKEMGTPADQVLTQVLSCPTYKKAFNKFRKLTPVYPDITVDHIVSAITLYYSSFSDTDAPFDRAMNHQGKLSAERIRGFNLFMSKAQCGTCHFVPQFNGVKPPYISSEFEVIGVPSDTAFTSLSQDSGRYRINPASETLHAFRTGSLRNMSTTKPYMHNGRFTTLEQVVAFYNNGGGAGRGLKVTNQTLSSDSLHLTAEEQSDLIAFITSLDETPITEETPKSLPHSKSKMFAGRKVGGEY